MWGNGPWRCINRERMRRPRRGRDAAAGRHLDTSAALRGCCAADMPGCGRSTRRARCRAPRMRRAHRVLVRAVRAVSPQVPRPQRVLSGRRIRLRGRAGAPPRAYSTPAQTTAICSKDQSWAGMWKGLIRQLVCWTSQHRAPTPQDIDALDDATLDMLGVETIPTFLLMRRGNEAARLSGVAHKRPAKPLAAAIRKHLLQ